MRSPIILRRISGTRGAHLSKRKEIPGVPLPYGGYLPFSDHLLKSERHGINTAAPEPRIMPQYIFKLIGTLHSTDTQVAIAVDPPQLGSHQELWICDVPQHPHEEVMSLILERLIVAFPANVPQHAV